MPSRRRFLSIGAAAPVAVLAASPNEAGCAVSETISLTGTWEFRLDSEQTWRTVTVPHTWQAEPPNANYRGVAWYRREFDAPPAWADSAVRAEFEAVFHTATVSLNGMEVGRHVGKGYTAFQIDLNRDLRLGARNTLLVRVDNAFNESMLPRGRSSDWAHDGGIYRPVSIYVTPRVFLEGLVVDSMPDLASGKAVVHVSAIVRNTNTKPWQGSVAVTIAEEATGLRRATTTGEVRLNPSERKEVPLPAATVDQTQLWHFDHPHLYIAAARLSNGHSETTTFGIRKIETRDGAFFLNGERVRLMGAERMAGSNPEFGMAEPLHWLDHDNADLRNLNCIYTRVHWPQDRRLLDWCDRNGMFLQTEVPTWGPKTFEGMGAEPNEAIMQNGLEQLREMIARDRNHPCLFSWGVCNEIDGQNPPAYAFAKRMYEEAKALDPNRLVTYASNSLQKTPGKDVAGLMDYIMWNEYYESWYGGSPTDLARNLDEIHAAFPSKAIVISEYGYCACTPERPEGDGKRISVLREHDAVFHNRDYVAGLIFFCYNDYRTHIGDRGTGVLQQRIHGVVDLYGTPKPSYEALRAESSPIEHIDVAGVLGRLTVNIQSRRAVPAYTLRGYKVRAIVYGYSDIPLERSEAALPVLQPGARTAVELLFAEKAPSRVQIDILRPDGSSTNTLIWRV
jgi:beta-galactosidase